MGTSILLVFIIPAMIVEVLFGYISGAFMGYPTAKVELPYDEATGLVWEYDNVDDPYIILDKTETKDGKQVFYFESSGIELETKGDIMELVFTDKNGNEEVFYCYSSAKINAPSIYSADQCTLMEITLTAENPVEGGKWVVAENGYYILYHNASESESETYTFVFSDTENKNGRFSVNFAYVDSDGVPLEFANAVYKYADGEYYLYKLKYESASDAFNNFLDFLFEQSGLK